MPVLCLVDNNQKIGGEVRSTGVNIPVRGTVYSSFRYVVVRTAARVGCDIAKSENNFEYELPNIYSCTRTSVTRASIAVISK